MSDENKKAVDAFNELAEVYQQKYMNVDLYQESLECFLDHLDPSDCVLDLACGPGNVLLYLYNKQNDLNLSGIDLSEEMIRLARSNVPKARFEVADCRNLKHIESRYNAIVCSFLLPYLSERETELLLSEVSRLLAPNGIFYIGFISDRDNHSEMVTSSKGHHLRLNYYSSDFVSQVLLANKITIEHSKSYTNNNPSQSQKDHIIVAKKSEGKT